MEKEPNNEQDQSREKCFGTIMPVIRETVSTSERCEDQLGQA